LKNLKKINPMFKFNKTYFILSLLIFFIEVLIALYINDKIVRPYIGDVLVVILLYCFVKAFMDVKVVQTAIFVLLFAFLVETLQYLNIVEKLGLNHSKIARTIIGTSFEWIDLIAYTFGILLVILVEKFRIKKE